MLALVAAAEVLAMASWFSASAISSPLAARWDLSATQVGWLVSTVQLGFVAGTALAALLNLADLLPSRSYFATSAALTALFNGALLWAPGFHAALLLRFLTGVCLAGVYPPAMKMIATWFKNHRGLAIGTVVGALTLGKASPYLLRAISATDPASILWATSWGSLLAAALVGAGYRDGPFVFERRAFSWTLAGTVFRHRETRLAVFGYLGHMWELYAMWTWIPVFLAASLRVGGRGGEANTWFSAEALAFGAIAAGALGCVWGGWVADRLGRERLVNLSMAVSGGCSLLVGAVFGGPPILLAVVTWVWGFFIVADSAQFSTLVTEVAPDHAVGTALTLQTSLGFLLTLVTIQAVPRLVEEWSWPWAFPVLALGPAFGILAMRRLATLRS